MHDLGEMMRSAFEAMALATSDQGAARALFAAADAHGTHDEIIHERTVPADWLDDWGNPLPGYGWIDGESA